MAPRTALSGVRISWDIVARKLDLARVAASAASRASVSTVDCWSSTVARRRQRSEPRTSSTTTPVSSSPRASTTQGSTVSWNGTKPSGAT